MRVVSTLLFGPLKSFMYLSVAAIISILLSPFSLDLPISLQVAQSLIGAACVPVAFKLLSLAIGQEIVFLRKVTLQSWRVLLIAIVASSVINALLQSTLVELSSLQTVSMSLVFSYLIGDILGAITVIFTTYLLFERLTQSSPL